jgi:hypothetical protein
MIREPFRKRFPMIAIIIRDDLNNALNLIDDEYIEQAHRKG